MCHGAFLDGSAGKETTCKARDMGSILGSGRSLGEGMATHSSFLAWKVSWAEEPHRLQSMGSKSRTWLSTQAACVTGEEKNKQKDCSLMVMQSRWKIIFCCVKLLNLEDLFIFSFYIKIVYFIFFIFLKIYFIFKLYIIVLVLPNIKMNPPQVYTCLF